MLKPPCRCYILIAPPIIYSKHYITTINHYYSPILTIATILTTVNHHITSYNHHKHALQTCFFTTKHHQLTAASEGLGASTAPSNSLLHSAWRSSQVPYWSIRENKLIILYIYIYTCILLLNDIILNYVVTEGSLEVKLPTINDMDRWKSRASA